MKRRQLLKASIAGGVVLGTCLAAAAWLRAGRDGEPLAIESALQKIDALEKSQVTSTGKWNPHQVFSHCAQTVEYSMAGYPAPKPKLFQDTVGSAAFAVFSSRQKMMHGLSEPIDGAPVLEPKQDAGEGLARLRQALRDFQQFKGTLAPHFAYGSLTREEYEAAHVMHFWNHLDEIVIIAPAV